MPIKCELVQRTSKNGNRYFCLVIYLTEKATKMVFLSQAELELINLTYQKVNK